MKWDSPQYEQHRLAHRAEADDYVQKLRETLPPKWAATGKDQTVWQLLEFLDAVFYREQQYVSLLRKRPKPPKLKKCTACYQRKWKNVAERKALRKFRAVDPKKTIAVIESISECWPDWRKVPENLWNDYIDFTGICGCGRPLAPKVVYHTAGKAKYCSAACRDRAAKRRREKQLKEYKSERAALAEAVKDA